MEPNSVPSSRKSWLIFVVVVLVFENMFLTFIHFKSKICSIKSSSRGAWVAQLVKCPTLDLSSGLDLRVMSSSPVLGSALGMEPTQKSGGGSWSAHLPFFLPFVSSLRFFPPAFCLLFHLSILPSNIHWAHTLTRPEAAPRNKKMSKTLSLFLTDFIFRGRETYINSSLEHSFLSVPWPAMQVLNKYQLIY